MNVYEQNYSESFIKELPVDFHKIKNMDLSKIDKGYHCLFTTDWNWGRYSTMDPDLKILIHEIYLDYLHKEVRKVIANKKNDSTETQTVGFLK